VVVGGELDDVGVGTGGGELGSTEGGVVTELPEGATPARAVLVGDAVRQARREGVEEDVEDAVLDAEQAFADVVEQRGGTEVAGDLDVALGGEAFEVAHGEDGVATVARALGEEEL